MDLQEHESKLNARGSDTSCPECGLTLTSGTDVCPNDGTPLPSKFTPGGKIAGKYEFLELIGSGAMSDVYRARDPLLKRDVAIKLLHRKHSSDSKKLMRFQKEGEAIAQLEHPHILHVYELGISEHDQPFIVMDCIEGTSLSRYLEQNGPLEPQAALDVFKQITSALVHAHSNGILHRDLKPSNVMIRRNEQGKLFATLVDFGMAKILADDPNARHLTATGDVIGSPTYMSPEQCQGFEVDTRSDIYSLGCLMYEAMCGKPVFEATTPLALIYKQTSEKPQALSTRALAWKMPERLEDIINKALEKKPEDRFQSAADLLGALADNNIPVTTGRRRIPAMQGQYLKILPVVAGIALLMASAFVVGNRFSAKPIASNIAVQQPLPRSAVQNDAMKNGLPYANYHPADPTQAPSINLSGKQITEEDLRREVGVHPMLLQIDLSRTPIHNFQALTMLAHLQAVSIADNNLGDDSVKQIAELLPNLSSLDLSGTKITDECASSLAKMKHLHFLLLDDTEIGDKLIGQLPTSVVLLSLNKTKTTDRIAPALHRLENLGVLRLGDTEISDQTLKTIAKLPQIQWLEFESPNITAHGISELSRASQLTSLALGGANVDDKFAASISRLRHLTTLLLIGANVTDAGIKQLALIPKLEILHLNGCAMITDHAIDALAPVALTTLDVTSTPITYQGLLKLKSHAKLAKLAVSSNLTPAQLEQLRSALKPCQIHSGKAPANFRVAL